MSQVGTAQAQASDDLAAVHTARMSEAFPWPDKQGFVMSVGAKGLFVFLTLIIYAVAIALFSVYQKNALLRDFENVQTALEGESLLAQAHVSIFHAIGAVSVYVNAPDPEAGMRRMQMHQHLFAAQQAALATRFPNASPNSAHVNAAFESASEHASPENLMRLILELRESEADLDNFARKAQEHRKALSEEYRARSDAAARTVFTLGALGMIVLGLVIGSFFRRLARDLSHLQAAALATVQGKRNSPILVTRHDEVGQLMLAINSMADTLDKNEKELMLERQKYFHQEKMAAIGVLAAGISHEIGNPIAAIAGIAQEIMERRGANGCASMGCDSREAELIYEQTLRLSTITREISEFASLRTAEAELLDLNAQLRSTSSLVRYDKRLSHVKLNLELDSQLPAIYGVADQLTQVIMNLLINAMDALEGRHDRAALITITTGFDAQRVWMVIGDNGCGISEAQLGRVFEAFFTTKPAGKGTGLGLSLCYSIITAHGGSIEMESTLGVGTNVHVFFPLNQTVPSDTHPL